MRVSQTRKLKLYFTLIKTRTAPAHRLLDIPMAYC